MSYRTDKNGINQPKFLCCNDCREAYKEAGKATCCKLTAFVFLIVALAVSMIVTIINYTPEIEEEILVMEGSD